MNEREIKILLDSAVPHYDAVGELDMDAVTYLSRVINGSADARKIAKGVIAASRDRGQFRTLCEAFVLAATISERPEVRGAAARAANNLTPKSRDAVLAVLKDDPDPGVQRMVANAAKIEPRL